MFSRTFQHLVLIGIATIVTISTALEAPQKQIQDTKILNLNRSELSLNIDQPEVYLISLYNVQGQEIRSLSQSYLTSGIQNLSFRGKGLPAGVYFVGLRSRSAKTIERFILK